jgi:hypothetical protein
VPGPGRGLDNTESVILPRAISDRISNGSYGDFATDPHGQILLSPADRAFIREKAEAARTTRVPAPDYRFYDTAPAPVIRRAPPGAIRQLRPMKLSKTLTGERIPDTEPRSAHGTWIFPLRNSRRPSAGSASLQTALHSRDIINGACGILMERHNLDHHDALEQLLMQARNRNTNLHRISAELTAELTAGTPAYQD